MHTHRAKTICGGLLGSLLLAPLSRVYAQSAADSTPAATAGSSPLDAMTGRLGFDAATAKALQEAIDSRKYPDAERLLLAAIDQDPHSSRAARLLAFAGSVYFLDGDNLHAAIAWKKSDAITPLDPRLQFSLAMAYLRIGKPDWARTQIESLAAKNPEEALYPYWLGRIAYDAEHYTEAIAKFQRAIALAPGMARAYDNLGLCYYRQNNNDLAVQSFTKAIALDKSSPHPSAWPYLNLAITQQSLDRLNEAEANLREAIRLDPEFAQAHFQLGSVLESRGKLDDALVELQQAARLNAAYPEPHMAMARIYNQMGKKSEAQEEVKVYQRLHPRETP